MRRNRQWMAYGAYGAATVVLFLYLLFPSDPVKQYLVHAAGEQFPEAVVSIGDVGLSFPPGLKATQLSVRWDDRPPLRVHRARLRPVWYSLPRPAKKFVYYLRAYGGALKGESEVVFSGENEGVRIVADIRDARLADMEFLRQSLPAGIDGRLEGRIAYERNARRAETVNARLDVMDCSFHAALPMIDFGRLEFGVVSLDVSLEDHRIQIRQLELKGNQANGRITGYVQVREPFSQSILNLKGSFTPHSAYVAELSKRFPVQTILRSRDGHDGFGFSIRGTVARPDFSFNRG